MFKKLNKNGLSWDDVSRIVYGVPDYAGNLSKMNNDTETDEILYPDNAEFEVEGEGIRCNVNGTLFTNFQNAYTLDFLDGVRGAVFIFTYDPIIHNFKKNQNACVYDENDLFLTGSVKDFYLIENSSGNTMQLEIISDAGVLLESNVPNPLDFKHLSVKDIIQRICDYWGIKVEFGEEKALEYVSTTAIGNSYSASETETAWDFICRIAKSVGCIVTDNGKNLYVGKIQEKDVKMSFIEGEAVGVTSWKPQINTNGLARYYEAHSQYPEINVAKIAIPFDYPIIKRVPNEDVSGGVLEEFLNWYVCREIGNAYKVILEVSDNLNIYTGDFVYIKSSNIFSGKETKMILEQKESLYPLGNILIFTLPCAYTGLLPKELPE